jgi:hypothetical protein
MPPAAPAPPLATCPAPAAAWPSRGGTRTLWIGLRRTGARSAAVACFGTVVACPALACSCLASGLPAASGHATDPDTIKLVLCCLQADELCGQCMLALVRGLLGADDDAILAEAQVGEWAGGIGGWVSAAAGRRHSGPCLVPAHFLTP